MERVTSVIINVEVKLRATLSRKDPALPGSGTRGTHGFFLFLSLCPWRLDLNFSQNFWKIKRDPLQHFLLMHTEKTVFQSGSQTVHLLFSSFDYVLKLKSALAFYNKSGCSPDTPRCRVYL